jgi:hypothetical protein
MLRYVRLSFVMLRCLVMDGHVSLLLTSVTITMNRQCSLRIDNIFTPDHVLSRMVTPSRALSRIILNSPILPIFPL